MATLRETLDLRADAASVWDAVRDVGALHTRLVPGFVVDTRVVDGVRDVTFANGLTAREHVVSVDDAQRRLAYAIPGQRFLHYQGTVTVRERDGGCTLVWVVDLLPDDLAAGVEAMMQQGAAVMRETLEGA